MNVLVVSVFALRLLTLILSSLILNKSIQKHQKFNSSESAKNYMFLLFGIGIFVFSLGDVIEEILFEFTSLKLSILHTIEGIINLVGLSMIIYSIYES